MGTQNYINHVVFVLDASLSMEPHSRTLVKVVDNQIKHLAERSKVWNQETRVTVYTFSGGWGREHQNVKCLIYDMDVLRVPSISGLYRVSGNTPLIDATLTALDDLAMTPEKYGEHSFLVFVLTDGQENSSNNRPSVLQTRFNSLPGHWTAAAFVPNQVALFEAKKFGFPEGNIAVWDTNSTVGIEEVGRTIRDATESLMENRTKGIRGTKSLFTLNVLSTDRIRKDLKALPSTHYRIYNVLDDARADDFVYDTGGIQWEKGLVYYQLTKKELVQSYKGVAVLQGGVVYGGKEARTHLGLPDYDVEVIPSAHPGYEIFVQSTAPNRKLLRGTRVLVMTGYPRARVHGF